MGFLAACNLYSSHGCQCSAMLHLLLYIVKRHQTMCFKSSKPIQIGLCMLMSLSIHLHGLHLDAQYNMVRRYICQHNYAVERTCRRLLWSTALLLPPYYPTVRFPSPSLYVSLMNHFRTRPMSCWLAQMGPRPVTFLWLWPVTDHEPHCRHVPINRVWRWTESTPRSGWWCSTRTINK